VRVYLVVKHPTVSNKKYDKSQLLVHAVNKVTRLGFGLFF